MPPAQTLLPFLAVTLAVLLVPGPSVVYVCTLSVEQGRRAGLWAVAGLETGLLVHVLAASLGLSALVADRPGVLLALKVGGAAYLAVLGIRRLRAVRTEAVRLPVARTSSAARIYGSGFVVDVLNPKTVLFLVALLPQFVDPARGDVRGQALLLGSAVVLLAVVCDGAYALMACRLQVRRAGVVGRLLPRAPGVALLSLAVLAAVS